MPRPDLEFDKVMHRYYCAGRVVPAVSDILGAIGDPYAAVPKWILAHKAKVGKALHSILEGQWRIPIDMEPKDRAKAQALAAWVAENQPEFLGREVPTVSLKHNYAGTWDTLLRPTKGEYRGKLLRIDVKSTSKLYPNRNFPQLEAYEEAERECGEQTSDLRAVLWLPVDRRAIIVESTDSFSDFQCILEVYNSQKNRTKRLAAAQKELQVARSDGR